MNWMPTTDFEDEIVALQPNQNFIFGTLSEAAPEVFYPRPPAHLRYVEKKKRLRRQKQQLDRQDNHPNGALNVIASVQRIAHTKPLGEQPTLSDWATNCDMERETIAMMRHFGLGPSIELPLDEQCTLPTLPITDDVRINYNGLRHMPVYFDERFFKLKPRTARTASTDRVRSSECGLLRGDASSRAPSIVSDASSSSSIGTDSTTSSADRRSMSSIAVEVQSILSKFKEKCAIREAITGAAGAAGADGADGGGGAGGGSTTACCSTPQGGDVERRCCATGRCSKEAFHNKYDQ